MKIRHYEDTTLLDAVLGGILKARELSRNSATVERFAHRYYRLPDDLRYIIEALGSYMGELMVNLDDYPDEVMLASIIDYDPATLRATATMEIGQSDAREPFFPQPGIYRLQFSIKEGWQQVENLRWHDLR